MLKKLERYAIKIYLYLINLEVSITISTDSLPTTAAGCNKSTKKQEYTNYFTTFPLS